MTRLAIFASGGGSNAKCIIKYFDNNQDISVDCIVCNNPNAGVIKIAQEHQIPVILISRKSFTKSQQLLHQLQYRKIDWIVLAGFLWLIPEYLIDAYPNKMINIHPALLPKYGGKGMYGMNVHRAVKAAGESESGMSIHYVNKKYDEGKLIFQARTDLLPEDSPEAIAAKVLNLEHRHYPQVIESLVSKSEDNG